MRKLNMIAESIKMSFTDIISNKMRSFLTMLGIVIGVAAVIGLITIVSGVTASVMDSFSSLGAGTINVSINGNGTKTGLTDDQLQQLKNMKGVSVVAPSNSMSTTAVVDKKIFKYVTVSGQDVTYIGRNKLVAAGRSFTESEADGNTNVCLVGKSFIKKTGLGANLIGQKIYIDGYSYQIIGVEKDNSDMSSGFTDDYETNGTVFVPYKNVMRMSLKNSVAEFDIYKKSSVQTKAVEKEVRAYLNKLFNNKRGSFYITNMESLAKEMESSEKSMGMMLGGIASIALIVGGIGIMNMMLTSVSERTREIGLKKALGAEPAAIQIQFLMESVMLSMMGGLIGVVLGILIARIGAVVMNTKFNLSLSAVALGIGFSAAVGIAFGWLPARRASRLNPIDALRSD